MTSELVLSLLFINLLVPSGLGELLDKHSDLLIEMMHLVD